MWTVETKTEDIVAGILSDPQPIVPAPITHIGACEVQWWEGKPKEAVVMAFGGSVDDRYLAEQIIAAQLAAIGYKRAQFTFDGIQKEAGWIDVMEKAKRLIQSNAVTVLRNGFNTIVGHVIGDHGEYNTEIGREDPSSRKITTWQCDCPWDQYAWQRCIMTGSMITLADGHIKPVEEISVGDAVIDHTGEAGIIADTHQEDWNDEVTVLRTTGFEDLVVKPDHPVLVVPAEQVYCRNQNGERAKFGKGRKGDFCALNTCGCRNPRTTTVQPEFKLAKEIRSGDFLVRPTSQITIDCSEIDLTEYMSEYAIIENDRIVRTREFTTRWGTPVIAKQKNATLPRSIPVTKDLLRLLGYYLAEGTITDNSVRFSFHKDEIEYHEDVARLGEDIFGLTPRYEHGPGTKIVSFNNRELAAIFTQLVGRHVTKKRVPSWAMWLAPDTQASLLEGWFNGDGHIRKSDGRHELTTVSPTLANQAELLLQRQEYVVGRIVERRSQNLRSSSKPNEKDAYKLYWLTEQNHNRGIRFRENNLTMVKLTCVERKQYKGRLIDLSVMGNPGFLAEGFAVHNTRKWKKYEGRPCSHVMALYWKALATPLDDYDPEQHGPMGTGQKQGPPVSAPSGGGPGGGGAPSAPPMGSPPVPETLPRSFDPQDAEGFSPPAASEVLPTPPMDQLAEQAPPVPGQTPAGMPANPNIVSVPGAKMPTPFNPIQFPGGTYSSAPEDPPNYREGTDKEHCGNCKMNDHGKCWGYGNKSIQLGDVCDSWYQETKQSKIAAEEFVAPEIVQLKEDCYGVAEGKSDAHGNGQYRNVPAGSRGEVLGQDPTTGWVECIFPLEESSYLEPYHVKCYVEPNHLMHTTQQPPGPFVKRR